MYSGVLALLGSGETAPGMTRVHRDLLARDPNGVAINLDTPYGFQLNVPQMTEKLVDYFDVSLNHTLTPVSFTSYEQAGPVEHAMVKQRVREASYVFAGPGSPSYALAQWQPLDIVEDFADVLSRGGTLCFSSAATLTLGTFTAPIYEIYKAGAAPYWLEGLDLLGRLGLRCAVIPHFDNHEGGNYDTRYCYLGEPRLNHLESILPQDVAILGVDEHTALLFDLAAKEARVVGRGHAYWRHHGEYRVLDRHEATPLDDLKISAPVPSREPEALRTPGTESPLELAEIARAGGPAADQALVELVRLAEQPRSGETDAIINALVTTRDTARSEREFTIADRLRLVLDQAGIELHDGPTGTTWTRATTP